MQDTVNRRGFLAGVATLATFTGLTNRLIGKANKTHEIIAIGNRRELFVDDYLIQQMDDARQRLHHPVPRGVAIEFDKPWEGNESLYITILRDYDTFRMYYRGRNVHYNDKLEVVHPEVVCYAESKDGINWHRPNLGLVEFNGSKENNIILDGKPGHNFSPFLDTNPNCKPAQRYKAVGGNSQGLWGYTSEDAIHWKLIQDGPIITGGAFDSQNIVFWDNVAGVYREYHRDFKKGRDIRTSSSKEFVNWPRSEFLQYTPGRTSELYTNQVAPYARAPHMLLGFPTRYIDRGWTESAKRLPNLPWRKQRASVSTREGTAVTDGMFMSSRDGHHFNIWPESFIRPGLRKKDSWFYGDAYQSYGLIETASIFNDGPKELSLFVTESALQGDSITIRRHTIRMDGFVSLEAPLSGGTVITKPISFKGDSLVLNLSTSAAGSVKVGLNRPDGKPYRGFAIDDCDDIYGDFLERQVTWNGNTNVSDVAGKPVQIEFHIKDADLYSFYFDQTP